MIKEREWSQNKFPKLKEDLLNKLEIKYFDNDKSIKEIHQNITKDDNLLIKLIKDMIT